MTEQHVDLPQVTSGLIVRPGDTLILVSKTLLSDEEIDRLRTDFKERLPDIKIAVLENFDQIAAYRPVPPLTDAEAAELEKRWVAEHGQKAT